MPRHPLDPLSLFAGLVFVGLGVAGLGTWIDLRGADGDWLAPVALVLLGLLVLGSIVTRTPPGNEPGDRGVGSASGSRDP
jgi:hypothetical protein